MSIRQLQYFSWLLRERHFGRAARRCHVSQSTLSMQIAKLEQTLGAELFERDRRQVTPTPTARAIAPLVEVVLEGMERIREAVHPHPERLPELLRVNRYYRFETNRLCI